MSDDEGEEKEESEADGEQHNDDENVKKDANAEYIDEERERYRKFAEKAKRSAVSRQGYSSLAQRLEEERKQSEREKARSERMLGRIGRVRFPQGPPNSPLPEKKTVYEVDLLKSCDMSCLLLLTSGFHKRMGFVVTTENLDCMELSQLRNLQLFSPIRETV